MRLLILFSVLVPLFTFSYDEKEWTYLGSLTERLSGILGVPVGYGTDLPVRQVKPRFRDGKFFGGDQLGDDERRRLKGLLEEKKLQRIRLVDGPLFYHQNGTLDIPFETGQFALKSVFEGLPVYDSRASRSEIGAGELKGALVICEDSVSYPECLQLIQLMKDVGPRIELKDTNSKLNAKVSTVIIYQRSDAPLQWRRDRGEIHISGPQVRRAARAEGVVTIEQPPCELHLEGEVKIGEADPFEA